MTATDVIFVDDREGSNRLMAYPPFSEIGELARLTSADVAFVGNGPVDPVMVGVEVKSIWDAISSMNTGRLQATQIPGLLRDYQIRWLLIYGTYRPGRDGSLELLRGSSWKRMRLGTRPVPYGYLESFLFDLVNVGVNVKNVATEADAATWCGALYRYWSKPWDKHKGMRTFDSSHDRSLMPGMDELTEQIARIGKELPGVGFERAIAAAGHFESVVAMVCASSQEWERVPGVGKVIAKAVVEAVRRTRNGGSRV